MLRKARPCKLTTVRRDEIVGSCVVFKGVMYLLFAVVVFASREATVAEAGRGASRLAMAQVCIQGKMLTCPMRVVAGIC